MSEHINITLIWRTEFDEQNVLRIAEGLKSSLDEIWDSSPRRIIRSKPRRDLGLGDIVACVRDKRYDNPNNNFTEPYIVRWVSYSPISDIDITVTFATYAPEELMFKISIWTRAVFREGIPIDEDAKLYRCRNLNDLDDDIDIDWWKHFKPAWPENVKILLGLVNAVKDLFPLIKLEIPPEILEPEKHTHMDLSEALQLEEPASPIDKKKSI